MSSYSTDRIYHHLWKVFHSCLPPMEGVQAFHELREAMTNVCRLERFTPGRPTEVHCDASATCLGDMLIQKTSENGPVIIKCASRLLTDYECCYTNIEWELRAVVWVVTEKFRHYTEGRKVSILTNHKALLGLAPSMLFTFSTFIPATYECKCHVGTFSNIYFCSPLTEPGLKKVKGCLNRIMVGWQSTCIVRNSG